MQMLIFLAGMLSQLPATKIEMHRGYPIIEAHIQGKGPYRMLVDTGNTSSSLLPRIAREIGLTPLHSVVVSSLAGDRTVPVANSHIRVGSMQADAELMISDLPGLSHLGRRLDGILGQNFLSRSPYLLDFSQRRMYFEDEAVSRAHSMPAVLPARPVHGRFAIHVHFDDSSPHRLVLDSGASHLMIYCRERCPHLSAVHSGEVAITNSGNRLVRRGTLRQATIGSLQFHDSPAVIVESGSADGEEADGLLPASWFSAIYVDSVRREIRLRPRSGGSAH